MPCGGNVVGTWSVTSSCLSVSSPLDVSSTGTGCTSAPVTGSLRVTGTWTANSDGTYADNTTTSGTEQIAMPASCLMISGTTITCDGLQIPLQGVLGYSKVICTSASAGGCTCTATVQQMGGMGMVVPGASTSGNYMTSNNVLMITNGPQYSYCVSGTKLTASPQGMNAPTGAVVLQKQ